MVVDVTFFNIAYFLHNYHDGSPSTSHAGVGQSDSDCVRDSIHKLELVCQKVSSGQTLRMG